MVKRMERAGSPRTTKQDDQTEPAGCRTASESAFFEGNPADAPESVRSVFQGPARSQAGQRC